MNKLIDEASKETGGLMGKVVVGALFGNPRIGPWLQKKVADGILKAEEIKAFENKVRKEYERIPEENIIEPNPRIILQALIAAEPILIEGDSADELQKMFARLIAAGCDKSKATFVHPSFSSIIGEMSPIDATLLFLFKDKDKDNDALPIIDYKYSYNEGSSDFEVNVFLDAPEGVSTEIAAISLQCLSHLGLLKIEIGTSFTNKEKYKKFKEYPPYVKEKQILSNPIYQKIFAAYSSEKDLQERKKKWFIIAPLEEEYMKALKEDHTYEKAFNHFIYGRKGIVLYEGIVALTAFGRYFLECCS